MSQLVTHTNRLRGHANAERSRIVRERILDIIGGQLGGRNGVAAQMNARETFIRCAVKIADDNGMRTWSDNTFPRAVGAHKSLAILFGERKNVTKGRIYESVNDGWVLDIWEATCNHYSRMPLFDRARAAEEPVRKLTSEDVVSLNDGGPKFIAEPVREKSLAMSVLEAYLGRNDEVMMQLIVDIEEMVGSH